MPLRHSTLHQLQIFEALARHLSVTRTARELHLTPPAVSIQMRQLAETLGHPLTEQLGKKLYLTQAGSLLAGACRDVLDRLERASQDLAELQGLEKGTLRLAILTTTKYLVPRMLGDFCEQHPGIDVSLMVGNRKVLLERLAENLDDLYVLGQPPQKLQVTATPFAANPLVLVAYPEHPLSAGRGIALQRLAGDPFIMREPGSGTRLACESFFREQGQELFIRMELASNEAIKQTVAGRLGVSILSRHTVRAELHSGELVTLDVQGLPLMRQWHLVHAAGKQLSPAARAFQAFVMEQAETTAMHDDITL